MTANCPMNLEHFPMDEQNCSLEIESYGYSTRDISYTWKQISDAVTISDGLSLAQFRIGKHYIAQTTINLTTGSYSRLSVYFTFKRNLGFYLIQIYLPSSLIVIISWVSFWLNREATQARVAIGVTTVLTMTTLMTSTNSSMPKVSYVKSIDIYLGTCFIIVFASLLEYAAVGYLMKRLRMKRDRRQSKLYGSMPPMYRDRPSDDSYINIDYVNEEQSDFDQKLSVRSESIRQRFKKLPRGSIRKRLAPKNNNSIGIGYYESNATPLVELKDFASTTFGATKDARFHNPFLLDGRAPFLTDSTPFKPLASAEPCDCDMEIGFDSYQNPVAPPAGIKPIRLKTHSRKQTFKPSNIDKYSRVLFPVVFTSFHIVYWTIYINAARLFPKKE